jgi:hypothetical protein
MRVPIRIIGIATSAIWAFLIIFMVTAIYSMKDVRLNIEQFQNSMTQDNQLLLSFPISIVNTGFYNLAQFNISTLVLSANGSTLANGSTFIPIVVHERTVNVTHDITLNLTDLLLANSDMLFDDSELNAKVTVSMRAAEAIPILASSNISIPWGAPLYNLRIGNPEYSTYNATHSRVLVPLSFENHAFFNLTGTVQLHVYDNANTQVTQTTMNFKVLEHSPYKGNMELYIPFGITPRIHFEMFFAFPFLNYGPVVVPYGN